MEKIIDVEKTRFKIGSCLESVQPMLFARDLSTQRLERQMDKSTVGAAPVFDTSVQIFATGVFLTPVKLQIDGQEVWLWVASSFEEDSFYNGELCNPANSSTDREKLLTFFDDD